MMRFGPASYPPERVPGRASFHSAMCDLHHQSIGYRTRAGQKSAPQRPASPQRRVDRIQQSGPGKRLFEEGQADL